MSDYRDGGNVIHIVGGDETDNQDGEGFGTAKLNYGGNGDMVSEPSHIPTSGSSSFLLVENDRSYKFRHCKQFYTERGCPFGDNCIYIHDENAKTRESLAITVAPGFGGGYRNVVAVGNGGLATPLPLAPLPLAPRPARPLAAAGTETAALTFTRRLLLAKTISSGTVKPLYWRTRICGRWEHSGYCQFGSKCIFAHGEAELQRYGGGPSRVDREAYQRAMVQNLPAPSGPFAGHALAAPAADAGGSRQMSGAMKGPIPSRNAWKVPKKINRIYGDWMDDSMP